MCVNFAYISDNITSTILYHMMLKDNKLYSKLTTPKNANLQTFFNQTS